MMSSFMDILETGCNFSWNMLCLAPVNLFCNGVHWQLYKAVCESCFTLQKFNQLEICYQIEGGVLPLPPFNERGRWYPLYEEISEMMSLMKKS